LWIVAKCGYITKVKKNLIPCKTCFLVQDFTNEKNENRIFCHNIPIFSLKVCQISIKTLKNFCDGSTLMSSSISMTFPNNFLKLVIKNAKEGALNGIHVAI
jgi:hypothetical protein